MIAAFLAVLAAVTLGPPFGEATATSVEDGSYLAVTVAVQVDPGFGAEYVVVHVLNPDGQETFTLGQDVDGDYLGTFTIQPFNRAIVFEAGRAGESTLSKTVSLIDLGIDPDRLQTTFGPETSTTNTRKWGWLALGAGALAGAALLAWWAWPKPEAVDQAPVDIASEETVVDETVFDETVVDETVPPE